MKMRRKYNIALLVSLSFLAASCGKDVNDTLSGDGVKTPLSVSSCIGDPFEIRPATKAVDGEFAPNDAIVAYIQHVRRATASDWATDELTVLSGTGVDPRLAGLKVISSAGDPVVYNLSSTDAQGLYWDDFSNSSSTDTDLRTADASSNPLHALQVKYAYCYNGGTPGTLTQDTGVLQWAVSTDQNADGTQKSDLLWASTQTPVAYSHAAARDGLTIPFTHALSKVTINVTCTEGFASDYKLTSAAVTLKSVNTAANLDAPSVTISSTATSDVKMSQGSTATPLKCTYTAIIVPTTLTVGSVIAKLEGLDGNSYDIPVTAEMLTAWSSRLTTGMTQSGVNYQLDVTVAKQQIKVSATITDWVPVSGETTGAISFANDVSTTGEIDAELKSCGFDIYQLAENQELTNANFGTKKTTYKSDGNEPANYIYDPVIYWPNGSDEFYFRALAPMGSSTEVRQGTDILWGTTVDEHDIRGELIAPRTGDVPLAFEHPLSKITVNVVDAAASSTDDNAKLDMEKAKIAISNLKTEGTLELSDGSVTAKTDGSIANFYAANDDTDDTTCEKLTEYVVIPQTITDASLLTITLADGTVYKAQLNQCLDGSSAKIGSWERGKHYTYTITIGKEEITFKAFIQDWDPVTGSGNATIDWD